MEDMTATSQMVFKKIVLVYFGRFG